MKIKGSLCTCFFLLFVQTIFAQRVKRKGTTPIEVNKVLNSSKKIFTLAQVQGKWQEFDRSDIATKNKTDFTDTLMLTIIKNAEEVKEGMSMTMRGEAAIESGNDLFIAGDDYSIVSVSDSEMVLNDGAVLKRMQPVKVFYLETVGKDPVKQASYTVPQNIMMADIMGSWTVYKKEAKPGVIKKDMYLVNFISLQKSPNPNLATGEIIISQNDVQQRYACTFILKDNTLQALAGNKVFNFNTYKADNDEFIFGNSNEVLNFAKRR